MDFSKTFDSVPHHKLLQKLVLVGTCYHGLDFTLHPKYSVFVWARNIPLTVMSSQVFPKAVFWDPSYIYINDLPDSVLSSIPHIFADDTKCIFSLEPQLRNSLLAN